MVKIKGIMCEGSYLYRKRDDMWENKLIKMSGRLVLIKPIVELKRGEYIGMMFYAIEGDLQNIIFSNYNIEIPIDELDKNYREYFYDMYEPNKHVMSMERLNNFTNYLEATIIDNDIDKEDGFYKTFKKLSEYLNDMN